MPVPSSRKSAWLRAGAGLVSAAVTTAAAVALLLPGSAPAGQSSPPGPADQQLATGIYHSCAVRPDGSLICWGFSGNGQLGYGNTNTVGETNTPASVGPVNLGTHTVTALAAGSYHTCVILDSGAVSCWGYGYYGALGYGATSNLGYSATTTPNLNDTVHLGTDAATGQAYTATAISAGGTPITSNSTTGEGMHTCVLLNTGDVKCWGDNTEGALGYPMGVSVGTSDTPANFAPVDLGTNAASQPATATAIAAGGQHTCAILNDGSVKCWGDGAYGQLGDGSGSAIFVPNTVEPVNLGTDSATGKPYTATAITAGDKDTCVILNTGGVECWGDNNDGDLGYGNTQQLGGTSTTTPDKNGLVKLGTDPATGQPYTAVAISAGADHTCVILNTGAVECWGDGANGELGYGNTRSLGDTPATTPDQNGTVDLGAGRTATAISAGATNTCARLDNGSVQCWGLGANGLLGHCNDSNVGDTPTDTPGMVAPVDIGSGGAECPPAPPTTTTTTTTTTTPTTPAKPPPGPSAYAAGVRAQAARARAFRACETAAARKARVSERTLRRYPRGSKRRARLLRETARRMAAADARCVEKFGRVPGRVTTLSVTARAHGTIALHFRAVSSDGSSPPAARSYLIGESTRPIRTNREFDRAGELCHRSCTFAVTQLGTPITLNITALHAHRTYYYAIVALDNVSRRMGPRSATVHARAS